MENYLGMIKNLLSQNKKVFTALIDCKESSK